MRSFGVELLNEGIEAGLLLQAVHARRPGSLALEGEGHALERPFCCGWPGLRRARAIPSLSHQTESLDRLNKALLAKGTPLSLRMALGGPRSLKSRAKAVRAGSSRVDSKASQRSRKREAVTGRG